MTRSEVDRLADRFDAAVAKLEAKIDSMQSDFNTRLENLESIEDQRTGRNNFINRTAKTLGAAIGAAAATVAIYLGLKDA